jgi:hypothetical protein
MLPVVLTAHGRERYRVPLLHAHELFCSQASPNSEQERIAPRGLYDVAEFLKTLPAPWRDPSLLLVDFDFLQQSVPRHLAAVQCPKVLLLGETHHPIAPLQRAIRYLREERYDLVILEFNRQHGHFLLEAGLPQTRWLPGFTLAPDEHLPGPRQHRLTFMGHVERHPYRWHILQYLEQNGVPGQRGSGPRDAVSRIYSETLVNLNVSLNGDLNLRVFEILAAGGFLLTDRLSPESGLDLLLENGRHLAACDDAADFLRQARHFLAHPAEAQAIAAAGHQQYLQQHTPAHKLAHLQALLHGQVPAPYDLRQDRRAALPPDTPDGLTRRLQVYELLQELHRMQATCKVLLWSGLQRFAVDLIDLPRLRVSVLRDAPATASSDLHAAGLDHRVQWLDRSAADFHKSQWNMLLCRQADLHDPLLQRLQQTHAADNFEVVDQAAAQPSPGAPAILKRDLTAAPVLLFAGHRGYYRHPLFHENELYCSHFSEDHDGQWHSFRGYFDVAAYLKTLPAPWNDPSLLLVSYDSLHVSIPQNLAAVKCPKVLLLGDTHHQTGPLQHALHYTRSEPFDLILLEYSRHHAHFLLEAGLRQVRWLPAFTLSPFEHPPDTPRTRTLMFMGQFDQHPYRRHVLANLQHQFPDFQAGTGTREQIARVFSETQVNLNISLNGDLNLRTFEVLAAGGFLLTDRLSPESGLDLLFQDRHHLVACDNGAHFSELARYYLQHRDEAQAIAAAGHAQYLNQHRPTHKVADLLNLLAGREHAEYDLRLDRRTTLPPDDKDAFATRLALYEMVQDEHRNRAEYRVLFFPGLERAASDVIDLPRVQVTVAGTPQSDPPHALQAAGLSHRVQWLAPAPHDFQKSQWHIAFCRQADQNAPLFQHLQSAQAADVISVVDTWPPPPIRAFL